MRRLIYLRKLPRHSLTGASAKGHTSDIRQRHGPCTALSADALPAL